jgi:hypothetical protein
MLRDVASQNVLTWTDIGRKLTVAAMFRNQEDEETSMRITFIAKDPASNPTGSPTLYRTDRQSWLVQGWDVTDPEALAQMGIPPGESAVEIPDRMIQFFRQEDRDAYNG